jgi:hypothetical protein
MQQHSGGRLVASSTHVAIGKKDQRVLGDYPLSSPPEVSHTLLSMTIKEIIPNFQYKINGMSYWQKW